MRTVFLGTPRAAVPSLRALIESAHAPAAVVCQPDKPVGRGRKLAPPAVKQAALDHSLPVLQPSSVRSADFREQLAGFEPELLVVVAYGRILGPKLLAVAPRGAVNVHFSLLPRWRGASPVQSALLAGDRETGVTIMEVAAELDAGDILLSEATPIDPAEHAPALESRLAEMGAALLVTALDRLREGSLEAVPQPAQGVTLAPPLRKEQGILDPRLPAGELMRAVRALDPWPGARLTIGDLTVAVLEAEVLEAEVLETDVLETDVLGGPGEKATDQPPGTVLEPRGETLPVACGDGTVLVLQRVKPAGKGPMSARALVNGRLVRPGDVAALAGTP